MLFESENESVRLFGIKLVRYLGLVDRLPLLQEKYNASSINEKIEILKCYDVFNHLEGLDDVYRDLFTKDKALLLVAVKVLKNLGSEVSTVILLERLKKTQDFESKMKILEAIYTLNPDYLDIDFLNNQDDETIRIIEHLKDPILNHV